MKKKLAAILTASITALSLAACGGAGQGAQAETPEPAAAEAASAAADVKDESSVPAPAETPAGEETEIQVFIAASLNTVMQEVAAAFNEQ